MGRNSQGKANPDPGAKIFFWASHKEQIPKYLSIVPFAIPGMLAENLIVSGASRTQTSTPPMRDASVSDSILMCCTTTAAPNFELFNAQDSCFFGNKK